MGEGFVTFSGINGRMCKITRYMRCIKGFSVEAPGNLWKRKLKSFIILVDYFIDSSI